MKKLMAILLGLTIFVSCDDFEFCDCCDDDDDDKKEYCKELDEKDVPTLVLNAFTEPNTKSIPVVWNVEDDEVFVARYIQDNTVQLAHINKEGQYQKCRNLDSHNGMMDIDYDENCYCYKDKD